MHDKHRKLLMDYKECLEVGVPEFIEEHMNDCTNDPQTHCMAKDMMMSLWLARELCEEGEHHERYTEHHYEEKKLTPELAHEWVKHMGYTKMSGEGEHWAMAATTSVAKEHGITFDHISEWCWYATMNMMYSDYGYIAMKFNIDEVAFCAEMSKAFLFDEDGKSPREKLSSYYFDVVKH